MKLLGIPCLESCGWIVALFGLVWSSSGYSQEQKKLILGGGSSDLSGIDGYSFRNTDLPKRIVFKPGEISLVADPSDHSGERMVVYLVNDTDQPMTGVVGEALKVRSEVRFGGYWFDREELARQYDVSLEKGKDLPPRHALPLGAIRSDLGDTEGEIRYRIAGTDIRTAPMRGRYEAARLFEVHPLTNDIDNPLGGAIDGGLRKNDWSGNRVARGPEEFCALLELARNHGQFLDERSALLEWLLETAATKDLNPEQRQVVDAIKVILKRPWMVAGDPQALADRVISALESKRPGAYGTPEKCRVVVWRYLCMLEEIGRMISGLRPETKEMELESSERLVSLAIKDLESTDEAVGNGAAWYLAGIHSIKDSVPAEVFLSMLQSKSADRNFAGLRGLMLRKQRDRAGPWLLDKVKANHPGCLDFYSRILPKEDIAFEDWEKNVIRILMESAPLDTLAVLRLSPGRDMKHQIPEECRNLLRGFLREELSETRRKWWESYSNRHVDRIVSYRPIAKS